MNMSPARLTTPSKLLWIFLLVRQTPPSKLRNFGFNGVHCILLFFRFETLPHGYRDGLELHAGHDPHPIATEAVRRIYLRQPFCLDREIALLCLVNQSDHWANADVGTFIGAEKWRLNRCRPSPADSRIAFAPTPMSVCLLSGRNCCKVASRWKTSPLR